MSGCAQSMRMRNWCGAEVETAHGGQIDSYRGLTLLSPLVGWSFCLETRAVCRKAAGCVISVVANC
jgi:hypothetical protein